MKNIIRRLLFISFLSTCLPSLFAGDPFFIHFSVRDGLSDNVVTCIAEDSYGNMWVGTESGLNRFDGHRWTSFLKDDHDPASICGNIITVIRAGKNGELWIGTEDGGICRYDPVSGQFAEFCTASEADASVPRILDILVTTHHEVYVSLDLLGIHRLNEHANCFEEDDRFYTPELNYRFFSLLATDRAIYAGQLANGLNRLEGNRLKYINANPMDRFPYPGHTPVGLHLDDDGIIWAGAWDNGLYRYCEQSDHWAKFAVLDHRPLSNNDDEIVSITSRDSILWLATKRSGFFQLNLSDMSFRNITHRRHDPSGLASNLIRMIYKDRRGHIWIATDRGINLYASELDHFTVEYLSGSLPATDPSDPVTGITGGHGHLFVATLSGIWIKAHSDTLFRKMGFGTAEFPESVHSIYYSEKYRRLWVGTTKTAYVLEEPFTRPATITAMYQEPRRMFDFFDVFSSRIIAIKEIDFAGEDVFVFSVFGHGMAVVSASNHSGFFIHAISRIQRNGVVYNVINDQSGDAWVLSRDIGIIFKPYPYLSHTGQLDSILNNLDRCRGKCYTDSLGVEVFALKYYHPDDGSHFSVRDMVSINDSVFYAIADGRGLFRFTPFEQEVFKWFSCPHYQYHGIFADSLGRIWLNASGGLDIYDPAGNHWYRFQPGEGLPEAGVLGRFYRDHTGRVYTGSYGRIVSFVPEQISFKQDTPSVMLTGFSIFDRPAGHLLASDNIRLHYRENFINFEFTAHNFIRSANIKYSYKLEGVNQTWTEESAEPRAAYTNLRGGKYTFHVKAINSNGIESAVQSLSLIIVPPFYQQNWFYALLALAAVLLVWLFYRYRVNQIHRIQAIRLQSEIEAQENERSRLARDLHDDLGTRLSALKLYISSLENYLRPGDEGLQVKKYAEELLDSSVDDLRNMLLNLSPESVKKYGFFAAVKDMAAKINQTGLIRVQVKNTGEQPRFDPSAELALYRIMQELMNNSIKHSGCSKIDIHATFEPDQLSIMYEDNGRGMDLHAQYTGYGFRNIANRLNVVNGTISWDTAPGSGLRAIINMDHTNHIAP